MIGQTNRHTEITTFKNRIDVLKTFYSLFSFKKSVTQNTLKSICNKRIKQYFKPIYKIGLK